MNSGELLTQEQILSLVHVVSPGADIVSCRLFPGKHPNLNYDLRLSNPTVDRVLKIYVNPSVKRTPWKETHLLRMLTSETGVPVPRVLHFDDSSSFVPHPWALHTHVPGQPLSVVIDTLDSWQLESIGYEMGRYLGHIHQIPLEEFGEFFVPDGFSRPSEKAHVVATATQWLQECANKDLLPHEIADALGEHFLRTELLSRRQACLLHGDYTPDNTIVEHGTTGYHVTGILEFECAQGGSPEQDMSRLFNWGIEGLPTFQKGLLDGYSGFGELVVRFWKRLRLYQAFTCLELVRSMREKKKCELQECRQRIAGYLASQGHWSSKQ